MKTKCGCCFFACPFISSHNRIAPENPVRVRTKEIKYNKGYISADLKIPVLSGNVGKAVLDNINNSIESDITEFNNQMEEAAKENVQKPMQEGKKVIPYQISNIYSITYNRNNIISISIVYSEYVGGTNSYIRVTYNYDLNTGKSLALEDLFIPGTNYRAILNREIRKELEKNKAKYFSGAAENFKGIAEDQPFYIEDGNLAIFFGFHQIAPLASEIPIIKIPFSQLIGSLKPLFFRFWN